VAYKFLEGDNGEGVPIGLLKAKAVIVFNTANTPEQREQRYLVIPFSSYGKTVSLTCAVCMISTGRCSGNHYQHRGYAQKWLKRVEEMVSRVFPINDLVA
jgi:hypothetical protein